MSDPDARIVGGGAGVKPVTSIAACYASFEQACCPMWPDQWRREARLAFYAGFQACMKLYNDVLSELPEAEQLAAQTAIHAEMERHVASILRAAGMPGKAAEMEAAAAKLERGEREP